MAMTEDKGDQGQSHSEYTKAYINILDVYKKQIEDSITQKNNLKNEFFKVIKHIMILLTWMSAIVLVLSIILFGIMAYICTTSVSVLAGAVVSVISSLVTIVLSIFKLPDIVATYLFNKDEDNQMVNIIKNIQEYETKFVEQDIERFKLGQSMVLNDPIGDPVTVSNNMDELGISSHEFSDSDPVSVDDVDSGSANDTVTVNTGSDAPGDLPPESSSGSGPDDPGTSDDLGISDVPGASA